MATIVTNSSVEPCAPGAALDERKAAERFEETRRAEALGRLRRTTFFLLPPLTLALAVNLRVFGDSTPVRALALVGMLGLAAVTHVVVGQRFAGRRAIAIAIAFMVALGVLLLGVIVDTPGGRDVHMGTVSALMMGAAIVIPWGLWPQLVVAASLALAYGLLPGGFGSAQHPMDLMISLTDCVALSTVGAYVLDRQRRTAFREREEALRVTHQREILLAASRELNVSLVAADTASTITRVARTIIAADTVALIRIDERRDALRAVSVAGDVIDVDREVLQLEVPVPALQSLLDPLRERGWVTTPGPGFEAFAAITAEQFGITRTLFVAIARDGRLLGYLTFNFRRAVPDFTDEQIALARGFAEQCAIALANAHLMEELQRANRVKTEFVSTMSHELRTPLSVILGYTDVLGESIVDLESRVVLDRIRLAGGELLDLVQTTLDLNRLESGQDPAQCESVSMHELWDELAGQFAVVARDGGVRLRWEASGTPVAYTDRRKLKIVVKNLIGNALKFTTEGEVHASVRGTDERCIVMVRDTGAGIAPEHLNGIFEMFRQVDNSDRRSHGGVGLGLYIVRRLVEQLGATLEVRSTVGVGTTFTVSLPLGPESLATAAAA